MDAFSSMTADSAGTMAIHAAIGKGKPTIWRWQARYMHDGADGLFRDRRGGRGAEAAEAFELTNFNDDAELPSGFATTLDVAPAVREALLHQAIGGWIYRLRDGAPV